MGAARRTRKVLSSKKRRAALTLEALMDWPGILLFMMQLALIGIMGCGVVFIALLLAGNG